MPTLRLIHSQTREGLQISQRAPDCLKGKARSGRKCTVVEFPAFRPSKLKWDDSRRPCASGEFLRGLSINARSEFDLLATNFRCPRSRILIDEQQKPLSILFLIEGQVNISMNSSDGRRFLLGIACAGDILGLTSAISGRSSEIRAEARYPCKIATMRRQDFLDFLARYPTASQNVMRELSLHHSGACERLRIFGVTSTVHSRLAGLLLEWCKSGRQAKGGTQIRFALTHEEIGECIRASRETVSRILADLRSHGLVRQRGSTLIVPSCGALAHHAGIDSIPGDSAR
jgi:CRP/FNR family cyclic AMP-dependent transcriptional regulator